mmetsp:Transcript_37762/g.105115  ORF Transcript_37762/g.105115 Transcript_37762/m.105115 type:complete len:392 (-) Transcript_37762:73-1248(-)
MDLIHNGDHGGFGGDEKAAVIADQLRRNVVKTLTICNHYPTCVTDSRIQTICEGLMANHSLQKLNLLHNPGIGSGGFEALANMMDRNTGIVELLLDEENPSYAMELQRRVRAATVRNYDAHVLEFEEVSIDSRFGDEHALALAESVAKGLPANMSVKTLHLKSEALGDQQLVALSAGLKANKMVETLSLKRTSTKTIGLLALAGMLAVNRSLKNVSMDQTPIEDDVAAALATALKDNTALERLVLQDASMSEEALRRLWTMVGDSSTLVEFDTSQNKMGPDAVKAVADALAVNSSLSRVSLWGCGCSTNALEVLAEAMQSNGTLLELQLWSPYDNTKNDPNYTRVSLNRSGASGKRINQVLKRNMRKQTTMKRPAAAKSDMPAKRRAQGTA